MIDPRDKVRDTSIDFSITREFIPQLAQLPKPPIWEKYPKLPQTIIAICAGILVGILMSVIGGM